MNDIKINDIKPLVDIVDYSFYLYYGLILFGIMSLCVVIYFIYKYMTNKEKNIRKYYFEILDNLDFNQSKQSAYIITKYGEKLAVTQREKQLLHELVNKLKPYKYKKEVAYFNDDVKNSFKLFMDSLDI